VRIHLADTHSRPLAREGVRYMYASVPRGVSPSPSKRTAVWLTSAFVGWARGAMNGSRTGPLMDIYSWIPESRTPFCLYKCLYGVCETVRVDSSPPSPPRWQYRGVVGVTESVDMKVFRFQCVESTVKMKGLTELVKAYPLIVIGGSSLGFSLRNPDSAAGVSPRVLTRAAGERVVR
jgi:hypothetical protein